MLFLTRLPRYEASVKQETPGKRPEKHPHTAEAYKNLLTKDEDFNEKDQKLLELFEEEVNKINQNKLNI